VALSKAAQGFLRNAVAVILYQKNRDIIFAAEVDYYGSRSGVTVNVGESFLENAEQSDLRVFVKAVGEVIGAEVDVQAAALSETFYVPTSGGVQSEFVEERRMEEVGDGADFGEAAVQEVARVGELLLGNGRRSVGEAAFELIDLDFEAGKILTDAVVEFTSDFAALDVLEFENAATEGAVRIDMFANDAFAGGTAVNFFHQHAQIEKHQEHGAEKRSHQGKDHDPKAAEPGGEAQVQKRLLFAIHGIENCDGLLLAIMKAAKKVGATGGSGREALKTDGAWSDLILGGEEQGLQTSETILLRRIVESQGLKMGNGLQLTGEVFLEMVDVQRIVEGSGGGNLRHQVGRKCAKRAYLAARIKAVHDPLDAVVHASDHGKAQDHSGQKQDGREHEGDNTGGGPARNDAIVPE